MSASILSNSLLSPLSLDPLDLSALLCSRVCHDVISPVGAIVNGLEVLEDEKDPEMQRFAIELIQRSARTASARLQFCRLAFGAAGSAGASIDTGDALHVVEGLFPDEKTQLLWNVPRVLLPKNQIKLLLNLCLIAATAIARGGVIQVSLQNGPEEIEFSIHAEGPHARLAQGVPALLEGQVEPGGVDAHGIQAFYTGLIARSCGAHIDIQSQPDSLHLQCRLPSQQETSPQVHVA